MDAVQEGAQWLESNPSFTRSQLGQSPGRLPASAFSYRPIPGLTRAPPLAQTDFISGVASDILEFAFNRWFHSAN